MTESTKKSEKWLPIPTQGLRALLLQLRPELEKDAKKQNEALHILWLDNPHLPNEDTHKIGDSALIRE